MALKSKISNSNGYAVAEFALTVPVLIGLLSVCIWVMGIALKQFELENYVHNTVRTLARGQQLSIEFQNSAPLGMTMEVESIESQVRAEAKLIQTIPIINKQIELVASAQSVSEIYVD